MNSFTAFFQQYMRILGCIAWFSNNSEESGETVTKHQISSMTAVRSDLEQAIKDLLEILPGYYRMTNNETLGTVLPKIKELIDRTV
ncbi:hypothetical protein [Draconibacterium orientale]|uniref:hypothetical protein n=1 Tax=Draconibacterium orientale TaxID=1168034 RepID=UPI002A0A5E81|nr:hypothetical protein [Draconibacterium orientale]